MGICLLLEQLTKTFAFRNVVWILRSLRRGADVQKRVMFRLRNLVLLWLARKAWSIARPAAERRWRSRNRTSP